MDSSQGVDHALRLEASERPAAERDVEALALDVERLGAVDAEADTLGADGSSRRLDPLGVRVERIDARGSSRREAGEPSVAAPDLEDSRVFERHERFDPPRLRPMQVGDVHA